MKKGDTVWIFNTTMAGRVLVEGNAEIVKVLQDKPLRCTVRFVEDEDGETYDRFIDLEGQDNPVAYAESQNKPKSSTQRRVTYW